MKTCPTCHQLVPDTAQFCPSDGTSLTTVEDDPLLGSVIAERYLLLQRVGEGSSGIIYRAEHVALRTRLAIKLLHHKLSQDDAAVEHFREEATRVAQLDSDHIVQVSDFGRAADERLFFAMEFLEGETLAATLGRDGKLSEGQALEWIEQLVDALSDAHELNIVHGDLRPRNIFLVKKKKKRIAKLLDFGLAKLSSSTDESSDGKKPNAMADPRYMSPEQARGGPATIHSDIYALSIIAYEMLTGAPPFVGAGTYDVLTKHLEAKPVPVKTKAPQVSSQVAAAIDQALHKNPSKRFSSVEDFFAALSAEQSEDKPTEKGGKTLIDPPKAAEPNKPEPKKVTPKAAEPKKIEPKKTEPKKTEPKKTEPKKTEPKKTEPKKTEPKKTEPKKVAPKSEPEEPESKKAELSSASSATAAGEVSDDKKTEQRGDDKPVLADPIALETVPSSAEPAKTMLGMGITATDVMKAASAGSLTEKESEPAKREPVVLLADDSDKETDHAAETVMAGVDSAMVAQRAEQDAQTKAGASGEGVEDGLRPESTTGEVEAFSEADSLGSRSMNWFAEGVAAEKELETRTRSGPLPAIYEGEEDEIPRRGLSATMVIVGVVVFAALALGAVLYLGSGDDKKPAPKPVRQVTAGGGAAGAPDAETKATADDKKTADKTPDAKAGDDKVAATDKAAADKAAADKAAADKAAADKAAADKAAADKAAAKAAADKAAADKAAADKAAKLAAAQKAKKTTSKKRDSKKRVAKKRETKKRDAATARVHVKTGRSYLRRGGYRSAKTEFKRALSFDSRSAAAHAGLGEVAFEEGLYATAAKYLRKAIRYDSRNVRYMVMLGHAYFKLRMTKQAVQQYRKALKINPNSSEARSGLQAAVRRLAGK